MNLRRLGVSRVMMLIVVLTMACSPGACPVFRGADRLLDRIRGNEEEAVVDQPTGEATLEPTDEATAEPTPTEPVETPTEEVTTEPTETATMTPTIEPTDEPTTNVKLATIQIEAEGSFVDPGSGQAQSSSGRGSGFIINEAGIAVTNNHVVTGAALLRVWVGGETEPRRATILGVSECSDLAVIDIEGDEYPYLGWYEGEIAPPLKVLTAGFPLGDPEFTMTAGIVSKARANGKTDWASVETVIEHDATINPGNSGGPLVTEEGQVVAVNYAGNLEAGQYFAIPRDEALKVINQLREGQDVDSIGINGRAFTLELDDGTPFSGIWIASVKSGSPADRAGIRGGDIIISIEGLVIAADGTMADYCNILRSHGPEDTFKIEVFRLQTEQCLGGQINGRELRPVNCGTGLPEEGEVTSTPVSTTETPPSPATGPKLIAGVTTSNLNVRSGPGTEYGQVTRLNQGDRITILQRTQAGDWLEIQTSGNQKGWAASQFVSFVEGSVNDVPVATQLPPKPAGGGGGGGGLGTLALWGNSASGSIGGGQERWFTFDSREEANATIIAFLQNAERVELFIYHGKEIPKWPHHDPNSLPNVGAGSEQGNRDQNDKTKELIWQGPVERNTKYYVRFINRGGGTAQYCIITRPDKFSCP